MKVAIIGAGRSSNGIGPFIAKYFQRNGCDVCALLTARPGTAGQAAIDLKAYGIRAVPYGSAQKLFEASRPDAVAIASPTITHLPLIMTALAEGCHIFCEKPFLWGEQIDMPARIGAIFNQAEHDGLTIGMNSQWPFTLDCYRDLCGLPAKIERFEVRLSPICEGREMILDSAPHALSLIHAACGEGELADPRIDYSAGRMRIRFNYHHEGGTCKSLINLVQTPSQPRPFAYGFNGRMIQREIDTKDYSLFFRHGEKRLAIPDPLEMSVQNFIAAVRNGREPLIGKSHILKTTSMLKAIFDSFSKRGIHETDKKQRT